MKSSLTFLLLFLLFVTSSSAHAFEIIGCEIKSKVDVSFAIADLDILESGKTIETLHMKGVKADAYFILWKGICLKPGLILLGADGQFSSYSIAVGQYIPFKERFYLLPNVGVTWSYLRTKVDIPTPFGVLEDLNEHFRSISPFVGLEFSWKMADKWYLNAVYQYAWSRTHTNINAPGIGEIVPEDSQKSKSDGPNYGLGLEYSMNDSWSITLGAGYNITLSHEKHGIRGKGAKLGVSYYF